MVYNLYMLSSADTVWILHVLNKLYWNSLNWIKVGNHIFILTGYRYNLLRISMCLGVYFHLIADAVARVWHAQQSAWSLLLEPQLL
jgi:hypothetical protein